jgi:hypothetical protein
MDRAVLQVVQDELSGYSQMATVRHRWVDGPKLWMVEVEPANPRAAPLTAAFDGPDNLSVTVGETWFEMFPTRGDHLDDFRAVVRAVFDGRVEEAGIRRQGRSRIHTDAGTWTVGHASLWLWRWRRHRRYESYGQPSPRSEVDDSGSA